MSILLTADPFDAGAALGQFCQDRTETGAVACFTGLARAEAGDTDILELEHYPGFTEAAIAGIVEAATARFGLHDACVIHRVGRISPGETIVFVAAAGRHRREAFEACDFLMDYLKSKAPFWKKSHGPDGARWIEPRPEDHADLKRWEQDR